MNTIKSTLASLALIAATAGPASAAYFAEISVVGDDVVSTGHGSLNIDALTFWDSFRAPMQISGGWLGIGVEAATRFYQGISGPRVHA
jgi:hypothetical protein